ncbi:MAG: bamB 2 [Myxococcales bacterium]|nr:bamB 2 [Myxococcales bacterium]
MSRRGARFRAAVWGAAIGLGVVGAACERDRAEVESEQTAIVTANNAITQAADEGRTGWFSDQPGLDPSVVGSGSFKRLFQTTLPLKDPTGAADAVYAQPLVNGSRVFVASASNNLYSLDAITGAVVSQRNLGKPYDPSALQCGDQKWVGTTGTAVIDALTNTAYFFSKVADANNKPNWYFRGVDANTLADKFAAVLVSGNAANDPTVPFNAELEHQRPGVLLLDGVVYAAFGAHCDKNFDTIKYRGWIIGYTTAGAQTTLFATEDHTGTQAGIWHSGGGLVSDGAGRIFFLTGNGSASKAPTVGTSPPATLGQSLVRVDVQADKSLKAMQYFEPYNLIGDQDFASGGPVSLPSAQFGTAATPHLMLAAGKLQTMYVLDRDHLGGYEQSPALDTSYNPARHKDVVVSQVALEGNGSWSKPAVWPGDGGWVYQIGSGAPLMALKYALSSQGIPTLSIVGHTPETYGFSSGAPIVTSAGTTPGSAVMWISQTGGGGQTGTLRAYKAVPGNGTLQQLFADAYGKQVKFTNPGVGAGRVYMGGLGTVTGYGSSASGPVSAPATDFGTVVVGVPKTLSVVVTAHQTLSVSGISSPDGAFKVGAPTPAFGTTLANGGTLTLPVTFMPAAAKAYDVSLAIATSAGAGSAAVRGTGQSSAALLAVSPASIAFGTVTLGTTKTVSVLLSNTGNQALTFSGFTQPTGTFSASGLPAVGATLAAGASQAVDVTYAPVAAGTNSGTFAVQSSGGNISVSLTGAGGQPPRLVISNLALGYGDIAVGTAETLTFTVSNAGGSDLVIVKSKPPSQNVFVARAPALPEATVLTAGQSVVQTVVFTPPAAGTFSDLWTINSNDDVTGLLDVQLTGSAGQTTTLPRTGWIASATASSATDVPSKALDGATNTRFTTGKAQAATGQSFEVDLGAPQTFTQLTLNAGNATDYPVGYQVFTSTDGATWGAAIAAGAGSGQLTVVPVPEQTKEFVKVALTAAGTKWWSVAEFNLASGGGGPPPPPTPPTPASGLGANSGAAGALALAWSASTTAGVTYSVFRGLASGFTPNAASQIAAGLAGLSYTDAGLAGSTTYFYVVEAVDAAGASAPSNEASATTLAGATGSLLINCGGLAAAPYVADQGFTGGTTLSHANTIDVSTVTNPAPTAVYQTGRLGTFSYTLPGFLAGSTHTLRLHFAETYFSTAGSRTFNVTLNGAAALTNFDILQVTGAKNKATVQSFTAAANANGAYVIQVTTVVNNGLLSGIEIQ